VPPAGFGDRETPPAGTVVMFDDALSEIPAGWALCDGNNGTPNMLDRFPRAASSSSDPGSTGGQNSYALGGSQMPNHVHNAHLDDRGYHNHSAYKHHSGSEDSGDFPANSLHTDDHYWGDSSASSTSGSDGSHSHSGSLSSSGGGSSVDNRPRFRELAFIMKL
jgi:microcystin-dependent protein